MYENENKQPDTIFVGITDGKNYSIVGEGYPYAKEYISKEKVMQWFDQHKQNSEYNYLAVCIFEIIEEDFVQWLAKL